MEIVPVSGFMEHRLSNTTTNPAWIEEESSVLVRGIILHRTLIMSLFFVESTHKCMLLFLRISILYTLLNILLINIQMNNFSKHSIG